MNKLAKKILALLTCAIVLVSCSSVGYIAFGDDTVAINDTNFPDKTFQKILKEKYDLNSPYGYLSAEERDISLMSFSGALDDNEEISDLTGIEFFAPSLKILHCGGIGLQALDVSALTNLTSLTCQGNNIKSLDVSTLSSLIMFDCSDNDISDLNLGAICNLEKFYCSMNRISELNVSPLSKLKEFNCDQNELSFINVASNLNLEKFLCSFNHLTSLDLSKNTKLEGIGPKQIGDQSVSTEASIINGRIGVNLAIDYANRITSTTLDKDEKSGYSNGWFYADDISEIADGIKYTYFTGLDKSEDMNVSVEVSRNFYQVNFYTTQDLTELMGKTFVPANATAQSPDIPPAPQCKEFDCWSSPIENVTSDMNVYIVWRDMHSYSLTGFENKIATISCSTCGNSYTVNFEDCINTKNGDSNFCEYLDVVKDGYINAKDYAQLIKMF